MLYPQDPPGMAYTSLEHVSGNYRAHAAPCPSPSRNSPTCEHRVLPVAACYHQMNASLEQTRSTVGNSLGGS